MSSNPVETSEYFLGFICNCLSCFTTVKITFTSTPILVMECEENCLIINHHYITPSLGNQLEKDQYVPCTSLLL